MPASVPSLQLNSVASPPCASTDSVLTAKPWFWLVMMTWPVRLSWTGWLDPRWPNLSLKVSPPMASERSWWPRQMPYMGTWPSRPWMVGTACSRISGWDGSPGPLLSMMPSGSRSSTSSTVAFQGARTTSKCFSRLRRMECLQP